MAAVRVELPDEGRVGFEGFERGQRGGVVGAPEAASTSKSGQSRGGGEACAQEGHDAPRALEVVVEGG